MAKNILLTLFGVLLLLGLFVFYKLFYSERDKEVYVINPRYPSTIKYQLDSELFTLTVEGTISTDATYYMKFYNEHDLTYGPWWKIALKKGIVKEYYNAHEYTEKFDLSFVPTIDEPLPNEDTLRDSLIVTIQN